MNRRNVTPAKAGVQNNGLDPDFRRDDDFHQDFPLLGKTVVVTRPRNQSEELVALLKNRGARVVVCPAIKIVPLMSASLSTGLKSRLAAGGPLCDWLVFLSANGVRYFEKLLGRSRQCLAGVKICAVGPKTRQAIQAQGWVVNKMAPVYRSESLLKVLGRVRGQRILIPRGKGGPKDFILRLKANGAIVEELPVYKTVFVSPPPRLVKKRLLNGVDAVLFTSPSTVEGFRRFFNNNEWTRVFRSAVAASIGPTTSRALQRIHVKCMVQAKRATAADVVKALGTYFQRNSSARSLKRPSGSGMLA
ncbi:MAG: uroporphyrinogen-III synthase [Elusimicrobia bacterium]|nr:uroporphyrinogen-III synthase [Candidatus Obscuribacterium magneticum]